MSLKKVYKKLGSKIHTICKIFLASDINYIFATIDEILEIMNDKIKTHNNT